MNDREIYIYSFYRFKNFKKIKLLKTELYKLSKNKIILGTILIANEGINGTISGKKECLDFFIKNLKKILKVRKLQIKISRNNFIPFYHFKIKLKKEIVTIGMTDLKPDKITGKHIHPKEWDKLIYNKNYLIIDTRNEYEVQVGSFENSINPKMKSFKDFPRLINKMSINKNQPIAMFCTGGIRCEKASSYLIHNGFKNVVQLDGGILNYLDYSKDRSKITFHGECFVFDNRVALNKRLSKGKYDQCHGCRSPITEKDKELDTYKKGVSCKFCINHKTEEKMKSSLMRQDQIDKAEKENKSHPFKKIYAR